MDLELIAWATALLVLLLWIVRQVHIGLQELFYLLSGDRAIAIYLFQILLLPGVVLHEFSHFLLAKLLSVRVRKVSFEPQIQRNNIQMGAVVLDRPDSLRSLLIGLAPLVTGSISVVLVGYQVFDVSSVIDAATASDRQALISAIRAAFLVPDAWIWFYLIFAVSNAMLPSESDREALWPMLAFLAGMAAIVAIAGWGPALLSSLAEPVEAALSLLAVAFGITLFVDAIFLVLIRLVKVAVTLLTGRQLERGVSSK